ncbi:uncharacterized protein LOC112507511 [Cynara cardunculus var. scolymus]|uniref:uncharacterized protein LOC112507511 n=1 Tax=Cynara cardunculus var. scolymus TaxID=59895 RepID=UPI000D630202|nr:uncharacterized protein LOC112507511 [Cynara cardunculus var. scolymus]
MMLRSSSTPILGSLLPSISSESPNHHHHHHHDTTLKPSPIHKFSPGSQHFTTLSCTSSPISPSVGHGRIRRAQSEGNLEHLISSGGGNGGSGGGDQFSYCNPNKKTSSRLHSYPLETIPSFSYQNSNFKSDDDESGDDGFGDFNVENTVRGLNKQLGFGNLVIKDEIEESGSQMYLAKGIGVDAGFGCADGDVVGGGGGGGRNLSSVGRGGDSGGDNHDVEEHYRKMVNENPGDPLLLRNYAQFLYQSKQDLQGAEEYYSRAILVDPNDGEILSQYAKLLWEVHHDKDRATSYFKRAVHVASEDSHVHAAYASFLWEIEGEEDDDDEDEEGYFSNIPPLFSNGTMASATA